MIPTIQGVRKISSANLMLTQKRGPVFLADTAINPDPTAEELADIALMTATTVQLFGMEPVTAMISYSNFGSSNLESPRKIQKAVQSVHERYPDLIVDGEIQLAFDMKRALSRMT